MGCILSTEAGGQQESKGIQKMTNDVKANARRIVFARPLEAMLGGSTTFTPPVFPKSDGEEKFLKTALPKNFVFENVDSKELGMLVKAMEKISINNNEIIIKQGDEGDFFCTCVVVSLCFSVPIFCLVSLFPRPVDVIYEGTVNFIVNNKIVGSGSAGDSFGELSLLYTTPRAATVKATSACTVYRVDQKVFRYILQQETETAVNDKTDLLKSVTYLKDLDDHAISKLAAVMVPAQFKAGDVIMRKNDTKADLFYILKEGKVKCTEVGAGQSNYEDVTFSTSGDHFGERALITGEPRAATITAVTDVMCFTIDKKTFEAVLGDFKKAILKSEDRQRLVRAVEDTVGLMMVQVPS